MFPLPLLRKGGSRADSAVGETGRDWGRFGLAKLTDSGEWMAREKQLWSRNWHCKRDSGRCTQTYERCLEMNCNQESAFLEVKQGAAKRRAPNRDL